MINLEELKDLARRAVTREGETVVVIPLTVWENLIHFLEATDSSDEDVQMGEQWWQKFDEFLDRHVVQMNEHH